MMVTKSAIVRALSRLAARAERDGAGVVDVMPAEMWRGRRPAGTGAAGTAGGAGAGCVRRASGRGRVGMMTGGAFGAVGIR